MSSLFHDSGLPGEGRRIMLATTVYDAPSAAYTFAMSKSREYLHKKDIQTEYLLLQGNCHVDDARNVVVRDFLQTKCDALVFIDADVMWEPASLLELINYDEPLVGGIYPFRRHGEAGKNNMPLRMVEGVHEPDERGLLEVEGLPTGFMKIERHVLETLVFNADHFKTKTEQRHLVPIIFERAFENGNRWGGDLNFCRKWRDEGGKCFAAYEMRLGHNAHSIVWDSLGAGIRRQMNSTLAHLAQEVKAGKPTVELFTEARRSIGNEGYSALEDVLMLCATLDADGPIVETGSGLTTIALAAAHPKSMVWTIENDPNWAAQTKRMAHEAGVENIAICHQPIDGEWYDLSDVADVLPGEFALGVNDGPSRLMGNRMGFFEHLAERCGQIVVDDADDLDYARAIENWCAGHGRTVDFLPERAALIR